MSCLKRDLPLKKDLPKDPLLDAYLRSFIYSAMVSAISTYGISCASERFKDDFFNDIFIYAFVGVPSLFVFGRSLYGLLKTYQFTQDYEQNYHLISSQALATLKYWWPKADNFSGQKKNVVNAYVACYGAGFLSSTVASVVALVVMCMNFDEQVKKWFEISSYLLVMAALCVDLWPSQAAEMIHRFYKKLRPSSPEQSSLVTSSSRSGERSSERDPESKIKTITFRSLMAITVAITLKNLTISIIVKKDLNHDRDAFLNYLKVDAMIRGFSALIALVAIIFYNQLGRRAAPNVGENSNSYLSTFKKTLLANVVCASGLISSHVLFNGDVSKTPGMDSLLALSLLSTIVGLAGHSFQMKQLAFSSTQDKDNSTTNEAGDGRGSSDRQSLKSYGTAGAAAPAP